VRVITAKPAQHQRPQDGFQPSTSVRAWRGGLPGQGKHAWRETGPGSRTTSPTATSSPSTA